jgi:hypothetical protein
MAKGKPSRHNHTTNVTVQSGSAILGKITSAASGGERGGPVERHHAEDVPPLQIGKEALVTGSLGHGLEDRQGGPGGARSRYGKISS